VFIRKELYIPSQQSSSVSAAARWEYRASIECFPRVVNATEERQFNNIIKMIRVTEH
jgi:hypothetical protein